MLARTIAEDFTQIYVLIEDLDQVFYESRKAGKSNRLDVFKAASLEHILDDTSKKLFQAKIGMYLFKSKLQGVIRPSSAICRTFNSTVLLNGCRSGHIENCCSQVEAWQKLEVGPSSVCIGTCGLW